MRLLPRKHPQWTPPSLSRWLNQRSKKWMERIPSWPWAPVRKCCRGLRPIDFILEAPINEKVDSEKPFLVLHQAVLNEVTNDHSETATISPAPPIESTEAPAKSDERSSTDPTVFTESPTVKEETSTVSSTTESIIPVDCPTLKDCPFDSCTFARKTDHRGCPTCHCLPPLNKSNFSCPILTCQACLYGHFTDVDGVGIFLTNCSREKSSCLSLSLSLFQCPICQCQTRPYPPLGERCPQLNCDPCYFGTVKDEYNCDSCICIRPNSQECPALNCTFGLCNYGSALDEDDCPTCECLLPSNNATEVNCTSPLTCPSCHLGKSIRNRLSSSWRSLFWWLRLHERCQWLSNLSM